METLGLGYFDDEEDEEKLTGQGPQHTPRVLYPNWFEHPTTIDLEMRPEWTRAAASLNIAYAKGEYEKGVELSRCILEIHAKEEDSPDELWLSKIHDALGKCLWKLGRAKEALSVFGDLIATRKGNHVDVWRAWASCAEQVEQLEWALYGRQVCVERLGKSPVMWLEVGKMYHCLAQHGIASKYAGESPSLACCAILSYRRAWFTASRAWLGCKKTASEWSRERIVKDGIVATTALKELGCRDVPADLTVHIRNRPLWLEDVHKEVETALQGLVQEETLHTRPQDAQHGDPRIGVVLQQLLEDRPEPSTKECVEADERFRRRWFTSVAQWAFGALEEVDDVDDTFDVSRL